MIAKPRVAIVGAGNCGSALAGSLWNAGYTIEAVMARPRGTSLKKAQRLARDVGARASGPRADVAADLFWFCVPDSEIARAAMQLAEGQSPRPFDKPTAGSLSAKNAETKTSGAGRLDWKGRVALHSSGALASDELDSLRRLGASVASAHPLMTFVRGSRPSLVGASFAVEGDAVAVRVARRVVRDLGGRAYSIRKEDKAAYHAWGTFASPLFTALLAITQQVAAAAGVKRMAAKRRMLPILQQTLANYAVSDAASAFSGPVARGDVDTVRQHLRVLRKTPGAPDVYSALARAALLYLPVKKKNELKKLLGSHSD